MAAPPGVAAKALRRVPGVLAPRTLPALLRGCAVEMLLRELTDEDAESGRTACIGWRGDCWRCCDGG